MGNLVKVVVLMGMLLGGFIYFVNNYGPESPRYKAKARQSEAKIALTAIYTGELAHFREYKTYMNNLERIAFVPEFSRRFYTVGFPDACVEPGTKPEQTRAPFKNALFTAGREKEIEDFFLSVKDCHKVGFEAYAVGVIRQGGTLDVWKIDEKKNLVNLSEGI